MVKKSSQKSLAVDHLTSRGNARQKIFFTDTDRELALSRVLNPIGLRQNAELYAELVPISGLESEGI
jgi:hypothetical protein